MIIDHYKDPYQTTSRMESKSVFSWFTCIFLMISFQGAINCEEVVMRKRTGWKKRQMGWDVSQKLEALKNHWFPIEMRHIRGVSLILKHCLIKKVSLFVFVN